jgi:hypothetical protein
MKQSKLAAQLADLQAMERKLREIAGDNRVPSELRYELIVAADHALDVGREMLLMARVINSYSR